MGWLDRIESVFEDRASRGWSGSVEDLLYEGEEIEREVEFETNRVVVTSHRVLAFTPGTDGENFHQVDRPNVTGVRPGHDGDDDLLYRAARAGVYSLLLVGIGIAVDFESLLPISKVSAGEGASRVGIGGMMGIMNRFLGLIGQIDDLMLVFGALGFLLVAVMAGVYLLTRERVLVVGVAGDEPDLLVPTPAELVDEAVADLEAALFPGPEGQPDGPGGHGTGADESAGTDREGFKSDGPL